MDMSLMCFQRGQELKKRNVKPQDLTLRGPLTEKGIGIIKNR